MVKRKQKPADDAELSERVAALAQQRATARAALANLRFVEANFLDEALVRKGLELGLSQGEVADQLGLSKRDVNRLANGLGIQRSAEDGPAANPVFDALRAVFLETVCRSRTAAVQVDRRCREHDAHQKTDAELADRASAATCTRCNDMRPHRPTTGLGPETIADMLAMVITHGDLPAHGPYTRDPFTFTASADGDVINVTMPHPNEVYPDKTYELTVRSADAGFPLPMTPPHLGGEVGAGRHDYEASREYARNWTLALADDPLYGPSTTDLVIDVGTRSGLDGRWNLVWASRDSSQ